jgi:hypothetical protein
MITYNGSSNQVQHGGVVGRRLWINGSDCTFEGMGGGGEGDTTRVRLIR